MGNGGKDVAIFGSSGKPARFCSTEVRVDPWIRTLAAVAALHRLRRRHAGPGDRPPTTCATSGRSRIASMPLLGRAAHDQNFSSPASFGGMVSGHLATLILCASSASFVGAGGLKATRKPTEKLHKLLDTMPELLAARRGAPEPLMLHDPRRSTAWRSTCRSQHDPRQDAQPRHGHQGRAEHGTA